MTTEREMPKYRSHKEVHAVQIQDIFYADDGGAVMVPVDEGYGPVRVEPEYVRKHDPEPDGYYVQYADGYESWSPREAFEQGYTRIK